MPKSNKITKEEIEQRLKEGFPKTDFNLIELSLLFNDYSFMEVD